MDIYLGSLKEKLMSIKIPINKYNNITQEEWEALFNLKNKKTLVIKGADKRLAVVVWERNDYIQEAEKQLDDKKYMRK